MHSQQIIHNGLTGMKMALVTTMATYLGLIEVKTGQENTISMHVTKMHVQHWQAIHGKKTYSDAQTATVTVGQTSWMHSQVILMNILTQIMTESRTEMMTVPL